VTTAKHERGHAALTPTQERYVAMQASPDFQDLRRRYRGWVLPVTAASLAWYFGYVALAAYAPGFMSRSVIGNVNLGLVLGLLQFVTTFAVTAAYVRHADTKLDPISTRLRHEFEEGELR
jgi:uncharacterized membrane protein (DUF485 family)